MTKVDFGLLTPRERQVVQVAAEGASTATIAERLFLSPRTVEHHLSSAYRKLGVSSRAALVAMVGPMDGETPPETRYANNGGTHLAFQVIGDGPRDLLYIPGFVSNVETCWTWPSQAAFLRRMARGRRLIIFDKRGTGLSDPLAGEDGLTLEQRMEDARAVLDAAGSRRATLFGFSEGAAMAMLFAATYPSRTNGLVLYGSLLSPDLNPRENVFSDPAAAWELMSRIWGTGDFLSRFAPTIADDAVERAHVARFERHGASPSSAFAIFRLASEIEMRAFCPIVHAPTLVLHRLDDPLTPLANSDYLGENLPNAHYVKLPGIDHPPWIGDNDLFFQELDRFTANEHPSPASSSRLLQAVLLMDAPASPEALSTLERFRGRPAAGGSGCLYTFDGAVRAVQCGTALSRRLPGVRIVVNAGEVQIKASGVKGIAVDVAMSALGEAAPGKVVATSAVKELTVGAGIAFTPLGPSMATMAGHVQLFMVD